MEDIKIKKLNIYPVKSCVGISVNKLELGKNGAEISLPSRKIGDREWMFLNAEGKFLTQRESPKLSLVRTQIAKDSLYLSFDNQQIELPNSANSKRRVTIQVWGADVDAAVVELPELRILSEFLGQKLSLVHFDSQSRREATKKDEGLWIQTRFTDSQPYLVVNQASLGDLNARILKPIPLSRFRANIEISGAQPFAEDHWQSLSKGSLLLKSSKACARCVMININQENLSPEVEINPEALKTLGQFRRFEKSIHFGQYFFTESFGASISVGDTLESDKRALRP